MLIGGSSIAAKKEVEEGKIEEEIANPIVT